MSQARFTVESCTMEDFLAVRHVIDQSESLDHHTDYTYWVALNQWPDLFLAAKGDGQVVGFAFGLRNASNPERVFLWQIGVLSQYRRNAIATRLMKEFCARASRQGASELWMTIADEITPSLALFRKIAAGFGSVMTERGSTGTLGGRLHTERIYSIALPRSDR
jgi:ribosomal protein S18 acetylase RimI-like enzyme